MTVRKLLLNVAEGRPEPRPRSFGGIRARLFLLVLLALLPVVLLFGYFIAQQRHFVLEDGVVAFFVVIASSLAVVWLVGSHLFVARLKSLAAVAERLNTGDLAARAEIAGGDEIAQVARSFNSMAASLAARIEDQRRVAAELSERVNKLVAARTEEVELLNHMGEMIQASTNLEEAGAVVGRFMTRLFPATEGALLISAPANAVSSIARWGERAGAQGVETIGHDDCWALRRGQPHFATPQGMNPRCPHVERTALETSYCVPLVVQGEVLGLFYLVSREAAELGDVKQRLALDVGEKMALALGNLKLRETLRHQSIRDGLTGLYNRRHMEAMLLRESSRAKRSSRPFSLIMVDIDHFKRLNDTHGHQAGDDVLVQVGKVLANRVRGSDFACRYGGEEFAILLPETDAAGALAMAEQVRAGVAAMKIVRGGEPIGPVTVSAGVAAFPAHSDQPDELVKLSDAGLYQAKQAGRNRVVVASRPAEAKTGTA